MSSFTTPLVASPQPDGRRWKLVNSFTYMIGSEDSGWKVVVRSGFVTDFASVPRLLWWLIPSWGKYGKAAVVHDFLYQKRFILILLLGKYAPYTVTRGMADSIFLEAMEVLGVTWWKRTLMYQGVRCFGWLAWR